MKLWAKYQKFVMPAVVLVEAVCIVVLALLVHSTNSKVHDAHALAQQGEITALQANAAARTERVAIDAASDTVYLPEFHIKLPLDSVSSTLTYSMRGINNPATSQSNPEADVTSLLYEPPNIMTRVDCSEEVRLKVEPKQNPYSPHEKPSTVSLADGRQLQIYQSVNQPECQQSWKLLISPQTIAQELQKAQSY